MCIVDEASPTCRLQHETQNNRIQRRSLISDNDNAIYNAEGRFSGGFTSTAFVQRHASPRRLHCRHLARGRPLIGRYPLSRTFRIARTFTSKGGSLIILSLLPYRLLLPTTHIAVYPQSPSSSIVNSHDITYKCYL